eukprot:Hpha_TRINITY_DN15536_c1_g2::TRINITY_DN15536_c1_g2_i7::g.105794::m.105794
MQAVEGAVFLPKRGVGAVRVYSITSKRSEDTSEHGLTELMEENAPDDNAFMSNKIDEELRHLHAAPPSPVSSIDGVGLLGESPTGESPMFYDTVLWNVAEVGLTTCAP